MVSDDGLCVTTRREHTLQELLAGVFTEEGVVLDGTVEVVDHQLKDGFDFLFGVTCIDRESGVLVVTTSAQTNQRQGNNKVN